MPTSKWARLRYFIVLGTVVTLVFALGAAQGATSGRWTRGDAEALLNNYPPGNGIYDRLAPDIDTRPLDIRPFQEFYGDLTYCAQDWHLLALLLDDAEFVAETAGVVHKARDAHAVLAGLNATFVLDGTQVAVEQKPIKPWLGVFDPGFWVEYLTELYGPDVVVGKVWATQWGRILAPGELSVGEHTLAVEVAQTSPSMVIFAGSVTFTVSPADSPSCAV